MPDFLLDAKVKTPFVSFYQQTKTLNFNNVMIRTTLKGIDNLPFFQNIPDCVALLKAQNFSIEDIIKSEGLADAAKCTSFWITLSYSKSTESATFGFPGGLVLPSVRIWEYPLSSFFYIGFNLKASLPKEDYSIMEQNFSVNESMPRNESFPLVDWVWDRV